ncbi:hypothetical protein MVEN_02354900 [Mycena venus]|uniref:Uncharacterized protein n=1 Tax=Mycena venus TaxID=2733690 RepID=A0A8H6X2V0_9AGAR|nr:hypothetical protein MVEN_02354900 [Mycena venus]
MDNQNVISFLNTAVTRTFGTIYLAVLVLVSQKLFFRPARSRRSSDPLQHYSNHNTVLQCSLSLAEQTAIVDAWSKKAITLDPDLNKSNSTWQTVSAGENHSTGNPLIDPWGSWYSFAMPASELPRDPIGNHYEYVSVADLNSIYFRRIRVTFRALWHFTTWKMRCPSLLPPCFGPVSAASANCGIQLMSHSEKAWSAVGLFAHGYLESHDHFAETRLNVGSFCLSSHVFELTNQRLNIIAVSIALSASIVLTVLSPEHLSGTQNQEEEQNLQIDRTGLLHAIWLYSDHPGLEALLKQVENPTDVNLRDAGMVQIRLVGPRVGKERQELSNSRVQRIREVVLATLNLL